MSSACSRRHQSYASFRLEVFQALFGPAPTRTAHPHIPSPRNQLRNGRAQYRTFGSSTKLSKQRGSRNVHPDPELRAFMEAKLAQDATHLTDTIQHESARVSEDMTIGELSSPQSRREILERDQDWTCPLCRSSNLGDNTTCVECSTPKEAPPRKRDSRTRKQWSPYSMGAQEDLKALVSDLKRAADEANVFKESFEAELPSGSRVVKVQSKDSKLQGQVSKRLDFESEEELWYGTRTVSLDLPESPLMRRLRKEKPHKRAPTQEEVAGLRRNPWASILASPVRQCHATGTRLPSDLLIPWSFVKRQADGATYLMPFVLADMTSLTSNVEEAREPLQNVDDDEEVRHSQSDIPPSNSGNSHANSMLRDDQEVVDVKRLIGKTTILPYKGLIERITTRTTRRDNGATVRGTVQRLLNRRVKEDLKQAQHYATGSEQQPEVDLQSLQWQPDIPSRMTSIMRERVLTVLESLGAFNGEKEAIVPIPLNALDTGRITVQFSPSSDDSGHQLKYSVKSADAMPEPSPKVPHMKLSQLIRDKFAGSFLIHVNSSPASIPDQPAAKLLSQTPKLLPQTISVNNTIRIPVFNLQQLLGFQNGIEKKHIARRYQQVLRSSKVLDVPKPNSHPIYKHASPALGKGGQPLTEKSEDERNGPAYLLFIQAGAPMAQSLARELWQLWRYQGGFESEVRTTTLASVAESDSEPALGDEAAVF